MFRRKIFSTPTISIFLASLLLAGCANQTALLPNFQDLPTKVGFKVVDSRQDEDKQTEWLSLFISSCDYGIRQFGDDATNPGRLVFMRNDLETILGPRIANATLSVSKYRIFVNTNAALRRSNPNTGTLVDDVLSPHHCKMEDMTGGWYSEADVTTPYSPIIIEMEAMLEQKNYKVRVVYSPQAEVGIAPPGDPYFASCFFEAMRKADKILADEIRKN